MCIAIVGAYQDSGIGAGDADHSLSAAERVALTDSYIAYYQQSLETHAERE